MQLPYDQFAQAARTLDYSDVNNLLRTQQAFVDGTVAAAPPPPPLHIPLLPPQPPPIPKTKKQPKPKVKKSEGQRLRDDAGHRMIPASLKRKPVPNQTYKNDFI